MPYKGGNGNGSSPVPGYKGVYGMAGNARAVKPVLEKTKSVSYNGTTSDQIFAISADVSSTTKETMPNKIEIENNGGVPLMIMTGYQEYSNETDVAGSTEYLHTLLMPGEIYLPPHRGVIQTGEESAIMDGTLVDNEEPNANMYTDSGADVDDGSGLDIIGQAGETKIFLEPWTSITDHSANLFRIGDLIRVNDEIMEITAISAGEDGGDSDADNLANTYLTVIRGVHGSTAASDHADDAAIRFPFFNAYHDFDRYSVPQTDSSGKFKCMNYFGKARTTTKVQGIVPGSLAMKFYQPGYQAFGMSNISSETNSGLTASTEYEFDITVDGGTTFDNLSFTTDSSNLNFGGTTGIIAKIQNALDTQFYTAGNLFEKKVKVQIVDGDIRFTSGSNLKASEISLGAGSSGTAEFFGSGRIPDASTGANDVQAAVPARLPDDAIYDPILYTTRPNSSVFCYDDGRGNLFGAATGTINYETGAIDFRNAPIDAQFVITCLHTSAFSGKLNESTTNRVNSIVDIRANTTSPKWNGSVVVRTY